MARAATVLTIVLATTAVYAGGKRPPIGSTAQIDRPLVIVDRTPIWASEVDEVADQRAHAAGMLAPTSELIANVIDELITNVLFFREADKLSISVTDGEVDSGIETVKQANHIDDAALDKALADAHFTRPAYREEIKKQIRLQKVLMLQLSGKVDVSDADVTREYEKRKVDKHDLGKLDTAMRDSIKEELRDRKIQATRDAWLLDLQRHAHIERRP
jgi:parvulin-like peptidyl-prolyl isomerase